VASSSFGHHRAKVSVASENTVASTPIAEKSAKVLACSSGVRLQVYKFSVYTAWEIFVEAIKRMSGETSDNAIELVRVFCFLH